MSVNLADLEEGVAMMWGWTGWPMMWGWGIWMWLVPLALAALLIWAVGRPRRRWLRRVPGGYGYRWRAGGRGGDPALQILRERLAKGEITAEEYEKLRERLSK